MLTGSVSELWNSPIRSRNMKQIYIYNIYQVYIYVW